jgi:hypothetical protein
MAMKEETWLTPLRCANDHRYEDRVLWQIHYIKEVTEPTNQIMLGYEPPILYIR